VPTGAAIPRWAKLRSETPEPIVHAVADGECSNPFRTWVLNHFWAWRSGMETFSNVANQCHFVPCPRSEPRWAKPRSDTPEPIAYEPADDDCSNPFCDEVLNRFWAWRSGMETFSKAANQCHFVPSTENDI
jgi:hypothetical protein